MKKKVIVMVLIACMSISAAACGKSEEPKKKIEAKKEIKEKKEYQKIGVESEEAFDLLIKNNMGVDITGIVIKTTAQTEYPANMMKSGEVWKNGDTVELFYTPDSSAVPTTETDKAINVGYSVQITLEDGRTVELTTFGFEDMKKKAELCFEDEVGFVKYVSKTSGDEMSTKEQEINAKAQKEAAAAAQAEAEAAAAAQAQAEAEAAAAAQAQAEAAAAAAQAQAEAAAQAQQEYVPEYTAPSNPGPTEVAPQQNTGGGCLGGVVIN